MSECMTIADETIDQKDTCTEITPKSIVDFILEEVLLSAFVNSDKGCGRIGDFNIADAFRQQQDQLPHPKDFEQIDHSRTESTANQESNLNSRENVDRSAGENLELLIDSFVKKEDKFKPAGEFTVITEEILANNELQIQNGQIHLEKNGTEEKVSKGEKSGNFDEKGAAADEKIEIEYFNEGKLNKIYVPLNPSNGSEVGASAVDRLGQERQDGPEGARSEEDLERPFAPFTTEELRQVWGNGNSSLVGKWDGDALAQREEAVRLMEELSSVHVFPDSSVDPNRPRACAFAEEDVKKIIKEIEEISFTQCHGNSEDSDVAYHPDGQGDADLEVKSSSKSKDNFVKSQKSKGTVSSASPNLQETLTISASNVPSGNDKPYSRTPTDGIDGEHRPECEVPREECLLNSSLFGESAAEAGSSLDVAPDAVSPPERNPHSDANDSFVRSEEDASGLFLSESAKPKEFQNDRNASEEFLPESAPLSGNSGGLTGSKIDEFRLKNLELTSELDLKTCQAKPSDVTKGSESDSNGLKDPRELRDGPEQGPQDLDVETPPLKISTNFPDVSEILPSSKEIIVIPDIIPTTSHNDQRSINNADELTNDEAEEGSFFSSQTDLGFPDLESANENGLSDDYDTKQFKLRSQKMFLGTSHEIADRSANDFGLTESEEAFIDLMESVIQIIDPAENNAEDDSVQISFSLLAEVQKSTPANVEDELPLGKNISSSDVEHPTKRVYSGMTTIGPMKNVDHDPKDLTAQDIDYGKMTRITSSRQLAKDFGLFGSEAPSIKILEEDDSDDVASGNTEEDRAERTSLVNRDIASLTKVQKIREVMSYQPKAEEDFEDEEVLARPRLDLKDVESMTDERYKVPDVPIPLLSFEIGETDLNPEKELIDGMGLVISGLTNPVYYEEGIEDDEGNRIDGPPKPSEDKLINRQSSGNILKDGEISRVGKESSRVSIDEQQQDGATKNQKYGTLGSVFKKASSKFLRKEGDLLMRNSKSLPRDASRVSTSDSIRSMIDDCQSSASNMLKKSRSLLKNTQGVFKSISQSRVGSVGVQKKPFSPSESDMTAIERKFSGFLKREDFTKAKNLIKEKVEKAFKNFEAGSSPEPETVPEKRNLRIVVRNRENLQVDRIENFKKVLPKTPLVYKSQFVKSQMNVQSNPQETEGAASDVGAEEGQNNPQEALNSPTEDVSEEILPGETDIEEQSDTEREIQSQDKLKWINSREDLQSVTNEEFELEQPDFIVMETVQGLLSTDLESPSSEKENLNVENTVKIETGGNEPKKMEASNSLQTFSDGGRDVAPCFTETDEEKTQAKSLERKIKTKKKKFTARFRNFWCSAFGRVKTSPGKGDLS